VFSPQASVRTIQGILPSDGSLASATVEAAAGDPDHNGPWCCQLIPMESWREAEKRDIRRYQAQALDEG
jgi:hypothetical protein